ncbi:uncharacterized protein N0V89_007485 [Didymosphaeria variabile]|uniref:Uncharacterized protein n=1 Tax=Didymosphaeria variabile TaxID=1932322 RepID=A0A9W8XIY4_9PLEO|nr:uncharacterized protein N0V89_007485 [Didymosphaeria variabile]KAJ4352138.1 hypothetical protein N0V89_007485 [Didymosphaeria variabile]
MPTSAEDDLIDLSSVPLSTSMTATRSASSPYGPAGKIAENNKPRQISNDSFASLTGLMKSKKTWAVTPKPLIPIAHGRTNPASPAEITSNTPTPTSTHPALGTASEVAVVSGRGLGPISDGRISLDTRLSPASPTAEVRDYDETDMRKMEDMIAQMRNLDTEAPSEWEVVPAQPTSRQPVEPLSQAFTEVGSADPALTNSQFSQSLSSASAFGFRTTNEQLVSRSKDSDSAFHPAIHQSIVRCTPQVWDTMIQQMTVLKKEKMEALAKLASLERDYDLRRQAKGDNSSELDELRYRLQLNKDHKAVMSRDIRQKDVELLNKDLKLDTLKKQVVDMAAMQEQIERLNAEACYLRAEAAKVAENKAADVGQVTEIIQFKDQEIAQLKEAIASTKAKVSDHQTRAENLIDTQTAREKKLRRLDQQLRAAQDTEEKLLDDLELLKTASALAITDICQEIRPLKMQAKDLETQLREKSSSCDRMRNDLKHTEKRLEVASNALHKIEHHKQLKGAAHLIVPSDQTKLPRLVLSCMECYAKNITCDANSRCHNCESFNRTTS